MWSNSRHEVARVQRNGVLFVLKNEQNMEKYIRTQIEFSQLKDKARSRNNVKVFSRSSSPPCRAFPTSSGFLGHKGLGIILPSSLFPYPHHMSFCY